MTSFRNEYVIDHMLKDPTQHDQCLSWWWSLNIWEVKATYPLYCFNQFKTHNLWPNFLFKYDYSIIFNV